MRRISIQGGKFSGLESQSGASKELDVVIVNAAETSRVVVRLVPTVDV